MANRLDAFILNKVFTPLVYFIDKWLHLNQYKQAFWCFQFSAVALVVYLARRVIAHDSRWFDWVLIPLLLLLYNWMSNVCRECSKDYEEKPYALPKRSTFFLKNTSGRMIMFLWALSSLLWPPYTNLLEDVQALGFFLYTCAFYLGAVTQPNKPRFEWSKLSMGKLLHAS